MTSATTEAGEPQQRIVAFGPRQSGGSTALGRDSRAHRIERGWVPMLSERAAVLVFFSMARQAPRLIPMVAFETNLS